MKLPSSIGVIERDDNDSVCEDHPPLRCSTSFDCLIALPCISIQQCGKLCSNYNGCGAFFYLLLDDGEARCHLLPNSGTEEGVPTSTESVCYGLSDGAIDPPAEIPFSFSDAPQQLNDYSLLFIGTY